MLLDAHTHIHMHMDQRGRVPQTTAPRGDVWPMLPFPNFQLGFSRACFLPLPRQPYPATSKETNTNTHLGLYIAVRTHPAAFPVDTWFP